MGQCLVSETFPRSLYLSNISCSSEIAAELDTTNAAFLTWNLKIQGSCDYLVAGQRIESVPPHQEANSCPQE